MSGLLKDEHLHWLALNEYLILLGDGLARVNEPLEKLDTPSNSAHLQDSSSEDELHLASEASSSTEVIKNLRLYPRCLSEQNAYCQFAEYKFRALAYYWYVQQAQLDDNKQKVYYSYNIANYTCYYRGSLIPVIT